MPILLVEIAGTARVGNCGCRAEFRSGRGPVTVLDAYWWYVYLPRQYAAVRLQDFCSPSAHSRKNSENEMHRSIRVLAAAAVAVTAAAGCGGSSGGTTSSGATKLTVGTIAIVDVAPIYLGKAKGFFTEQNLDVTLQAGSGGAVTIPAVVSGQDQFGFANVTSLLVAQTKGLPVKVVAAGNSSTGTEGSDFAAIVTPADSPIKTAKDLEDKTVAVNNLNNVGDTTVRASVRKAGGDATKVKFVEIAFPDMPAALAAKRIQAAWVVEPFLTVTRNAGNRVVSWNLVDTAPNMMVAAYFTTTAYAGKNPDVVKRFTTAMEKSLQYASDHPDEARAALATYTKITADVAAKITLPKWPTTINRESTQTLADLILSDKLVTKAPDVPALLP
jgi:NitT/TauT family transport system substrate-binding protein